MLNKILIANRGEIAVRVARACKELGIRSVAVFSDADRNSPHVWKCDEAYYLGSSKSTESYLAMDKIIAIALKAKAKGIHPGYGFLAENADFAQLCNDNRIKFIGPSAQVIRETGDKTLARRRMEEAGVPIVPGTTKPVNSIEETKEIVKEYGLPILLKAAAGGGGKGMRIVEDNKDLQKALTAAQNEARNAFGDSRIYVEKLLSKPRHVEIQILADENGDVIHLGERECSIQRRHQKVIEESPSTALTAELKERMANKAITVAKSIGYSNAGTIEFLVDYGRNFYFLEVNTRIQVEHPVTEMRTGVDIVQQQILIAGGEKLNLSQGEINSRGAAIECRISSEDPYNNFYPSTGKITRLRIPQGPGVRFDSGFEQGTEVTLFYDPLLAKLIVWAENRQSAIERMKRALEELNVLGIETNRDFHLRVMVDKDFVSGNYDTTFISEKPNLLDYRNDEKFEQVAAIAGALFVKHRSRNVVTKDDKVFQKSTESEWKKISRLQAMSKL